MPVKTLGNLLNPCTSGELGDIVRRAHEMGELARILSAALPGEAAGAIVAANVRPEGELVVIAASPAWASRLRYETAHLLDAARAAGIEVTSCRVRVTTS